MQQWLESLDRKLMLALNGMHHPWLDDFMWYASESWHTYLLAAVCAYFFYRRYASKVIWFILGCLVVVGATDLTSNSIKHSVKRYRPSHNTEIGAQVRTLNEYKGGKYGFVSSHAANAFGLVTFMALCFRRGAWLRVLLFAYAAIISYSRIYLGVHYPSDVFSGMILGILFGWIAFMLFNRYLVRINAHADRISAAR